jgi:nitrogen fixation protein NifU and related proteins
MSDLRELYQEVILDHNKRPRNFGILEDGQRAEGHNPLCGDRVTVSVRVEDGRVARAMFTGSGCAISKASASLMTDAVKGLSPSEVDSLFAAFQDAVTGRADGDDDTLGKLAVLTGVRDYPSRVKCATLAWHALQEALTAPRS